MLLAGSSKLGRSVRVGVRQYQHPGLPDWGLGPQPHLYISSVMRKDIRALGNDNWQDKIKNREKWGQVMSAAASFSDSESCKKKKKKTSSYMSTLNT